VEGADRVRPDEPHRESGGSSEVPTAPVESRPEWSVNWAGAGVLLGLAVAALIAWQTFGTNDDDSSSVIASDEVVETVATTTPSPSTAVQTVPTTVATPTTPTIATVATTTRPDRRVLIRAEMKPCRFGDDCLVASFTIEGFADPSGRFFCIYPNSRREFSFEGDGKGDACLTADQGDTITIEVDGVRSATVSETNLDGTTETTVAP
jgi:hypothetical protein